MKTSAFLLLTLYSLSAQSPKEILQKAYTKCQSIKDGYYEVTQLNKPLGSNDTSITRYKCDFKKTAKDKVSSSIFNSKRSWQGKFSGIDIYTGHQFIALNPTDSTATIYDNSKWPEEVASRVEDVDLFSLLTDKSSTPLPGKKNSSDMTFKLIGEEKINDHDCYRIQGIAKQQKPSAKEPLHLVRYECQYWIEKTDFLPIKYSIAVDLEMNKDTMYQYDVFNLDTYVFNQTQDPSLFSLASIPEYYTLKDYFPHEHPDPLPLNSIAPDWTFSSLQNETISLHDLHGNLVLIDFFFKDCYPCMLALPVIQSLHEKYHDKGLKIIGIDPFDKKPDELMSFLNKRGITYTILLGSKEIAQNYKVGGYPTIFLIDKAGNLIHMDGGYSHKLGENLENQIIKNISY